jgi:formylglycine-generating enzyme required for sulfatase activity
MLLIFTNYLRGVVLVCALATLGCVRTGFAPEGAGRASVLEDSSPNDDLRWDSGISLMDMATVTDGNETKGDGSAPQPDGKKDSSAPQPDQMWPADLNQVDLSTKSDQKIMGDIMAHATWVTIPAGTFYMGSLENEPCRGDDETYHQVTLTHAFEIQTTEVTQGQFMSLSNRGNTKFPDCGVNCPMDNITWNIAADYCNKLSQQNGLTQCYTCKEKYCSEAIPVIFWCDEVEAYKGANIYQCPGYRLPTEAEWEYAYRAGTSTALYSGEITSCEGSDATADSIAWYSENAKSKPHPVGQKQPNQWGLYDMSGNLWEWIHDAYQQEYGTEPVIDPWGASNPMTVSPCNNPVRSYRGGSWMQTPHYLRAAQRGEAAAYAGGSDTGFRCVRTIQP